MMVHNSKRKESHLTDVENSVGRNTDTKELRQTEEYILPHLLIEECANPGFSGATTDDQVTRSHAPLDSNERIIPDERENAVNQYQILVHTPETEREYSNDSSFSNNFAQFGKKESHIIESVVEEDNLDSSSALCSEDDAYESPPNKKLKINNETLFPSKQPMEINNETPFPSKQPMEINNETPFPSKQPMEINNETLFPSKQPVEINNETLFSSKPMEQWNKYDNLQCQWKKCDFVSDILDDFVKHVSYHVPELKSRINEDGIEVYVCDWENCDFETNDSKKVLRHVNFHSYHTKLKRIGSNILRIFNVPVCRNKIINKKLTAEIEDPFICRWKDCDAVYNNIQVFFSHIALHVNSAKIKTDYCCSWADCTNKYKLTEKLRVHVRNHTGEKPVACPTCGHLFANKNKFIDHCKRQMPSELQNFQCSYCNKYYASQCLLREHMRNHVNNYKCTFCDMTCRNPSALALHIRYRHLEDKPFACQNCDLRFKTIYSLNRHAEVHDSEDPYKCGEEDCPYSFRTSKALELHIQRDHYQEVSHSYHCHICSARFVTGGKLTKHLFAEHELRWPSGHSRFWYRRDKDGIYRLQTVRYESLELTEKMIQEKPTVEEKIPERNFRVTERRKNNIVSFILTEESSPEKYGSVLISIEEVDEEGNVTNSEVYEVDTEQIVTDERVKVICSGEDIMEGNNEVLPGKDIMEENSKVLPGEDIIEENNKVLPGEDIMEENNKVLPGEDIMEGNNEVLPGEDIMEENNKVLPGEDIMDENNKVLPGEDTMEENK